MAPKQTLFFISHLNLVAMAIESLFSVPHTLYIQTVVKTLTLYTKVL